MDDLNLKGIDYGLVDEEDEMSPVIVPYDILTSPNDFNMQTLCSLIDKGRIVIPKFQRHYVWDRLRASKFIESLILNLPVPQVFLYEASGSEYQIIDGQQRLLSAYFFYKGRFPKKNIRTSLRDEWNKKGGIDDTSFRDDKFYETFSLRLASNNQLHGKSYDSNSEIGDEFDMRTLRTVVIRQLNPEGNESIYEIFNRLNTGGINLTPQEIRCSIADSKFMDMLFQINNEPKWRTLIGLPDTDARLRDLEMLHRGFSMALYNGDYKPSMRSFLDKTAEKYKRLGDENIDKCKQIFLSFLSTEAVSTRNLFLSSARFSMPVFEAIFSAYYNKLQQDNNDVSLDGATLDVLRVNQEFDDASKDKTTNIASVQTRIRIAKEVICGTSI